MLLEMPDALFIGAHSQWKSTAVSQALVTSSSGNCAVKKSEQTFRAFPNELLPECTVINITLALTSCYFEQPLNERVSCT